LLTPNAVDSWRGNVVKAPDDVLLTITQIHPIYVTFFRAGQQLPANPSARGETILPVKSNCAGRHKHPAWGELTFIDNAVDMATEHFVEGTFANTNTVLWPGQFVQVAMTLSQISNAVIVPAQRFRRGRTANMFFLLQPDETVEMRAVTTGENF